MLPPTGWFSADDAACRADPIVWPADARNLTTLTIHYMDMRTADEREALLKILGFYFPKLEDVRCTYDVEYDSIPSSRPPTISGCMRRYRISNGELKWWYTGDTFKKLPDEPTREQWFGDALSVGDDDVPELELISSLSLGESVLGDQVQDQDE